MLGCARPLKEVLFYFIFGSGCIPEDTKAFTIHHSSDGKVLKNKLDIICWLPMLKAKGFEG